MTPRGSLSAFGAFGAFWGAWAVLVPQIKEQTGASVGALGVALLFIAGAALPSSASWAVRRSLAWFPVPSTCVRVSPSWPESSCSPLSPRHP